MDGVVTEREAGSIIPEAAVCEDEALARRRELALILMLASVQFTSIVDFMLVMPLGPQLERVLGLSPHQFGRIVSSYTIAAGVAGFVASFLMDRYGRKAAFLTLYAGFLLGTLLCGLAWSYPTLLAARVATGVFGGILGGLALAIVGDVVPENRRGWATGILMTAFALASALGVPVGLKLGTDYGWQTPFLVLAALGAPVFFVAMAVLPPLRGHIARAEAASLPRRLLEMFGHSDHIRAFLLTVALMFGGFSVFPYISVYLVANAGLREDQLFWIYMVGGLLTLFGMPMIGRAADHFGKLRVFRLMSLCTMAMLIVVTNLGRLPLWVLAGVFGMMMLVSSSRSVPAMAMITSSVESSRRGGFMSANSAVQHLAAGVAADVGGRMLASGPGGTILHFDRVGWLAAASTVVSLWLAGRLRAARRVAAVVEVQPSSR
jgi:DHA1 family inner membrane transport protein